MRFAKHDPQLHLEKLLTEVRSHDLIGLHMKKEEVNVLIKNNKKIFKDFLNPGLIQSYNRGIIVLLRKSSWYK